MLALALKLRCLRCGDWHGVNPGAPFMADFCTECVLKAYARGWDRARFFARYRRNTERHPTVLALKRMAAYG